MPGPILQASRNDGARRLDRQEGGHRKGHGLRWRGAELSGCRRVCQMQDREQGKSPQVSRRQAWGLRAICSKQHRLRPALARSRGGVRAGIGAAGTGLRKISPGEEEVEADNRSMEGPGAELHSRVPQGKQPDRASAERGTSRRVGVLCPHFPGSNPLDFALSPVVCGAEPSRSVLKLAPCMVLCSQ